MEHLTFEGNFCDIAGCQTMPCVGKGRVTIAPKMKGEEI